jgi:hypothetical protein
MLQPSSPDGAITLPGKTRLVIRAFDQVDGNAERRRLGIYRGGWQLLNGDLTPAGDVRWSIIFDRMPRPEAAEYVYGPGSRSGATGETIFNYIVTNTVEGEQYAEGFIDPAEITAGTYVLRAIAADQAGNITNKDILIKF